jgi:hypothetical protein
MHGESERGRADTERRSRGEFFECSSTSLFFSDFHLANMATVNKGDFDEATQVSAAFFVLLFSKLTVV